LGHGIHTLPNLHNQVGLPSRAKPRDLQFHGCQPTSRCHPDPEHCEGEGPAVSDARTATIAGAPGSRSRGPRRAVFARWGEEANLGSSLWLLKGPGFSRAIRALIMKSASAAEGYRPILTPNVPATAGCPIACPELAEGSRFWDLGFHPNQQPRPSQLISICHPERNRGICDSSRPPREWRGAPLQAIRWLEWDSDDVSRTFRPGGRRLTHHNGVFRDLSVG
jgi:hypothetical protein